MHHGLLGDVISSSFLSVYEFKGSGFKDRRLKVGMIYIDFVRVYGQSLCLPFRKNPDAR